MDNTYVPPLATFFIWNPADFKTVSSIIDVLRKAFSRDTNKPFSRNLNLPLFFISSKNYDEIPSKHPEHLAQRNIIFVFTSVNTTGRENWKKYVESIPNVHGNHIVPVALDRYGLSHEGNLSSLNCIRSYDWPVENYDFQAVVLLAHEIYRFGFKDFENGEEGINSSIKIFLSHAKIGDTGRVHAESIKEFIDNTNMRRFFDTSEISAGFPFDNEIENHISGSTMIAIESDMYSSRYWCQRELLKAKQLNCPVVVVNCLDDYEDRIFPAASNVPCIHVSAETPLSNRDILRILTSAILETIRHRFVISCLNFYQSQNWIPKDCEVIARPPEIRQVLAMKNRGATKICYPEPPIYSDEADWHQLIEVQTFTPLWNISEQNIFSEMRIGISISDIGIDSFYETNMHEDQLIRLAQDLSRNLLARSATLLYGGDLRPNGFTEFILDEALILQQRINTQFPHIENHLAWPLHVSDPEIVAWRAKYHHVMKTVQYDIPEDIASGIPQDVFLSPNTPENSYIWSRCLTSMRESSVNSSNARICAGGKLFGYKGKMPGVLEEIVLAIQANKALYLMGAFGGVTNTVCNIILNDLEPETLTAAWQISHNPNYSELQLLAASNGHDCNYESTVEFIKNVNIPELAKNAGLNDAEYTRLMVSPFIDECVHLILKGLKTLTES